MTTTPRWREAQTPSSAVVYRFARRPLTLFAVCLAFLAPGISSAKKPLPTPDAGCVLLLSPYPNYVTTGTTYQAKVVRDPSYPGAFRSPKVKIYATYPLADGGKLQDNDIPPIEVSSFYVTYVQFDIPAPPTPDPDNPKPDDVAIGEEAVIAAEVTETLVSKNQKRQVDQVTVCTTSPVMIEPPKQPPAP